MGGGDEENPAQEPEKRGECARGQKGAAGSLQLELGVLTALGTVTPRPLVKSIVEIHMETEAQVTIRVETSKKGLTLGSCSNSGRSLRISLLKK